MTVVVGWALLPGASLSRWILRSIYPKHTRKPLPWCRFDLYLR
jgi:hypothetical protein